MGVFGLKKPVCTGTLSVPLCMDCAAPLRRDEIAITKRLIGRGIRQYYCENCLARRLGVTPTVIRMKIQEYRAMGCALFCTQPDGEGDDSSGTAEPSVADL